MLEFVLIFLTLLPPITIGITIRRTRIRQDRFGTVLLALTLLHQVLLVTLPVLYGVFANYPVETQLALSVGTVQYTEVLLGETLFVVSFCTVFGWRRLRISIAAQHLKKSLFSDWAMILISFAVAIYTSYLIVAGAQLGTMETIEAQWSGPADSTALYLLQTLQSITYRMALWAAAFICFHRDWTANPFMRGAAAIILAAPAVSTFSSGIRGRVLMLFALLAVAAWFSNRHRIMRVSALLGIVMIPILLVIGEPLRTAASHVAQFARNKIELIEGVQEVFSVDASSRHTWQAYVESAVKRACGPANSSVLYMLRRQGKSIPLQHYCGILPVPYSLWPTQPFCGSLSLSSYADTAQYLVMEIGHSQAPGYTMGPLLASAHAYWEGGYLWVVIAGALLGLAWNTMRGLFYATDSPLLQAAALTPLFAFYVDGLMTTLYPLHEVLDSIVSEVFPVVLLYWAMQRFVDMRGSKGCVHSLHNPRRI